MVSTLNKSSLVDTEKISAYHWLMFGICFLGNVMGGTVSTLMSVYLPVLVKDLLGTVDESRLSYVSAYYQCFVFYRMGDWRTFNGCYLRSNRKS
jgi:hypothetical protein